MAGRGRGRGRGNLTEIRPGNTTNGVPSTKPQSNEPKSPIAVPKVDQFDELCGEFRTLRLTTDNNAIQSLVEKAKNCVKTDEDFFQVIDILYEKVFNDNEFTGKIAHIGKELSSLDEVGGKFRSCLLKRAQEHYKNRESLKKDSLSKWTGLLSLLCEIFKVLRISDRPLKPLSGPIYEMLGELLANGDDAELIECFYQQLRSIGKMLCDIDKVKMELLICKLRDSILNEKTTSESRCLLIELLELQASDWSLAVDVQRFYGDAMTDLLSSQCST